VDLLYICVRRTLPWHDEVAVAAGLHPQMRSRVALWNATFNLRYAAFRQRLTEIARENWSRIPNAKLAPLSEVPPGALIAPVDDDDWFSPELASRLLAEHEPARYGYHWNRYVLETPRGSRRWPWARRRRAADTSRYTCSSNNYAVSNLPELTAAVDGHVPASRIFDAGPRGVKHVAASLSVQSRNLASRTTLERGRRWAAVRGERQPDFSRDDLIRAFRAHRALYDGLRLPGEVAWAQPCVAAMAELMHELRPR
jgi:hypothetical protein